MPRSALPKGYDELSARQVAALLASLDDEARQAVRAHESATKARASILSHPLLADPDAVVVGPPTLEPMASHRSVDEIDPRLDAAFRAVEDPDAVRRRRLFLTVALVVALFSTIAATSDASSAEAPTDPVEVLGEP